MDEDARARLLVGPDWLSARLGDPGVRVFDCAVSRVARTEGPSLYVSERPAWEGRRIPGAGYLHMVDDLCDPGAAVPFTVADPEAVAARLAAEGVRGDETLVLYGRGAESAVHRVWWALRFAGFADVRVLDGGLTGWEAAGGPLESGPPAPPAPVPAAETRARLAPRPGLRADKAQVAAALADPGAVLVNALGADFHAGRGAQVFGRPGRIAGSRNLPIDRLIDPATQRFRPEAELRALAAGLDAGARIVAYCGGGIAATTLAFALALIGREAAMYDGSLLEWGADPDAPMETGPEAA